MAQHVKILGILHIVFGWLGILGALVCLCLVAIVGGLSAVVTLSDSTNVPAPILAAIGVFVFFVVLVISLPGFIIGIGLVQFRPWARVAGIVISALDLLGFPFHTLL